MKRKWDREEALFDWEERMIALRSRYTRVPGGFSGEEEAEQARADWEQRREDWRESRRYQLEERTLSQWRQLGGRPFVGRERELAAMREAFEVRRGPVFLTGLGGMGKTALAAAYAERNSGRYEQIAALTFRKDLVRTIADDDMLAIRNLSYRKEDYGSLRRYAARKLDILRHLVSERPTLLIVDDWNLPDEKHRAELFALPCDILVTTRLAGAAWQTGTEIPVGPLAEESEWRQLAGSCGRGDLTETEWERFAAFREQTGGHTLQALLYLTAPENRPAGHGMPEDFCRDLLKRFPLQEAEKRLLRELSVLPVQGIRLPLLRQVTDVPEAVLRRLREKLLIQGSTAETERVRLHPVVAEAVREVLRPTPENCRALLEGFARLAKDAWMRSAEENRELLPCAEALLEAFLTLPAGMARTWDGLLILPLMQEHFAVTTPGYRRLLAAVRKRYGDGHQLTGEAELRLAAAYFNAQDYEAADPWYRQACETLSACQKWDDGYEKALSEAHQKVSRLCRARRDYEKAQEHIGRAIRYMEQYNLRLAAQRGLHVETLEELPALPAGLGLAFCLLDGGKICLRTGRLEEAEAYGKQAEAVLARDERAPWLLTESFAVTERDKYTLELLTRSGRTREALALAERMLAYAARTRGPYHSYTLGIRYRQAGLLAAADRPEEAGREYLRLLHDLEYAHPDWTGQIRRVKERLDGKGARAE